MPDVIGVVHDVPALLCAADGPPLGSDRDAVDLIALALPHRIDLAVVPVARLDPRFFTLASGIAGQIVQKFVDYRVRLAVLGDLARPLAASASLRAFVDEANRGRTFWFVPDPTSLAARLVSAPRLALRP
jgi:hypothetical protein